jgi:heat-inducible transcriptional repressor
MVRSGMASSNLTDREERVLEAVIRTYVETAEPAGSRTVAKRFGLGVSPATVRNAMSDLEEKGFLFHPHTSAGRIPTDLAYRYYVDTLMRPHRLTVAQQRRVRRELGDMEGAVEQLIRSATQVLGLVTGELGLALAPRLDDVTLEKLELVGLSSDRGLFVLTLASGAVRTIYVNLAMPVPAETLASLNMVLNERLAGLSLTEIRSSIKERLRDSTTDDPQSTELLNIFLQSADDWLNPRQRGEDSVVIGRASVLAEQPEFSSNEGLRDLLELTEQRDLLARVLSGRAHAEMPTITIGTEHGHPRLSSFTLVTSEYRFGHLTGVIGVMGPTRMPYEKVATIVEYTSLLVGQLAGGSSGGPDAAA